MVLTGRTARKSTSLPTTFYETGADASASYSSAAWTVVGNNGTNASPASALQALFAPSVDRRKGLYVDIYA